MVLVYSLPGRLTEIAGEDSRQDGQQIQHNTDPAQTHETRIRILPWSSIEQVNIGAVSRDRESSAG